MKYDENKYLRRKRACKGFLVGALVTACMTLTFVWLLRIYRQIPGSIKLKVGEEQVFDIGLPVSGDIVRLEEKTEKKLHVDLRTPVTMKADTLSSYQMELKLFGWIPFKQVDIQVIRDKTLTPVGIPIGIYLKTDGVLIIGTGEFVALDGNSVSPAHYLLKKGDYIRKVDGKEVEGKKEFIRTIEESGGKTVVLTVCRDEELFDVSVQPVQNQSGKYKLGIWVRDNAQGVGTMTFVDSEGNFGALGHGINDVDTSTVMALQSGTLYRTEIIAIKKGVKGAPGEMTGLIEYSDRNILGIVTQNTSKGIFGTCNDKLLSQIETEAIPIGLKQDVEVGPAQILCTVDGKPRYYDIQIKELYLDHINVNKGIVLQVTDPELIAITGGIVQGMSGSPIVQNGRIIGAVTHVFVSDPTKGYGIFVETMLEQNK